jgi:lambda family phage portal protein
LAAVAPERALRRQRAQAQLQVVASLGTSGANRGADTAYAGASPLRRAMRSWMPTLFRNPDAEVLPDRPTLVARSRDAYRNQPIARAAVNAFVTSVIGSGLELHCRVDREFLAFESDEEATAWERRTERLFRAWAGSKDADARRKSTFYRLQQTAYKSAKHTGEIFALLPLIPRPNTICDLRVQLIEADRVSTPDSRTDGPTDGGSIWDGVETGTWGEPVAYHVEVTVPSQMELKRTWKRVLAYGTKSGRQQVIHFFEEDRPGQRRGLPFLAPILELLKQISRYSEAELMAAVISGMFTVFIKKAGAEDDVLAGVGDASAAGEDDGESIALGNGAIVDLQPGESIETANPGRPNQQFDPFVSAVIKQIGMGLNIPYEVLTKLFSSSYSASRAAIMQAWEVYNIERDWFVDDFLQPIYTEWLSQMVASGRIDAPGFFDDVEIQRAYCGARWYGPTPMQIDPVKEATAAKLRVDGGFSTRAEETERLGGGDWETNFTQLAREKARMEQLGLTQAPPLAIADIPDLPEQS